MAKFIVEVSIRVSNRFEIETDEYDGEALRIAELHLTQDIENELDGISQKAFNNIDGILVRGNPPMNTRWVLEDIAVDDVSFINPTRLKFERK